MQEVVTLWERAILTTLVSWKEKEKISGVGSESKVAMDLGLERWKVVDRGK